MKKLPKIIRKGKLKYFVRGAKHLISPSKLTNLILDFDYPLSLRRTPHFQKAQQEGKAFNYDLRDFSVKKRISTRIKSIVKSFQSKNLTIIDTEPLLVSKKMHMLGYLDAVCHDEKNQKIGLELKYRSSMIPNETDKIRFQFYELMLEEMFPKQEIKLEMGMINKKTQKIKVCPKLDGIYRDKALILLSYYNFGTRDRVEKENETHILHRNKKAVILS